MNKNGIIAALAVMAFAGVITQAIAPQNNSDIALNSGASAQNTTDPKPAADASVTAPAAAPVPVSAPVSDSLLSEVKVYPSF